MIYYGDFAYRIISYVLGLFIVPIITFLVVGGFFTFIGLPIVGVILWFPATFALYVFHVYKTQQVFPNSVEKYMELVFDAQRQSELSEREITEDNEVSVDFMEDFASEIQAKVDKARDADTRRHVEKALRGGRLSVDEIAEYNEVSVDYVNKIKAEKK